MSSFSAVFEWAFLLVFPIDQFIFFKAFDIDSSSRRIMAMYDKDWGYVSRSEPQTLRQALTSIDVILQIPFNKREAK